jgi:sterol desaturase/sphingolipid hydroxylase (fatty acid hydroxylase superfamily)
MKVLHPVELFLEAGARVFWLYLLGALFLALAVGTFGRRAIVLSTLRASLTAAVWWHPSARVDYLLVLSRPLVKLALIVPWLLSAEFISGRVVLWLYDGFGAPPELGWPLPLLGFLYTLTLFLVSDLSRFLLHLAAHRWAFLWQFHQVHHSAEVLTPLSLYRLHPVEMVLQAARSTLVLGLVSAVFAWLSHGRASVFVLFGVNVPVFLFNFLGANLRHSGVWLTYGPRLERWLISPAQHQIHHSVHPADTACNLGHCLALWDRLFGTLRLASGRAPGPLGISPLKRNHDPRRFTSVLLGPFRAVFQRKQDFRAGERT